MAQPLPKDPAAKRALFDQLQAQAPDLVSEINDIRALFPGARLTYLQLDGQEYGKAAPEGVVPNIHIPAAQRTTPEQLEKTRLAKKGREAKKRK